MDFTPSRRAVSSHAQIQHFFASLVPCDGERCRWSWILGSGRRLGIGRSWSVRGGRDGYPWHWWMLSR